MPGDTCLPLDVWPWGSHIRFVTVMREPSISHRRLVLCPLLESTGYHGGCNDVGGSETQHASLIDHSICLSELGLGFAVFCRTPSLSSYSRQAREMGTV